MALFNPNSDVGGDEMVQDAEPRCLEEGCGVSKDTVQPDEWHSRPADCARSPRSTSDFGFNLLHPNGSDVPENGFRHMGMQII